MLSDPDQDFFHDEPPAECCVNKSKLGCIVELLHVYGCKFVHITLKILESGMNK